MAKRQIEKRLDYFMIAVAILAVISLVGKGGFGRNETIVNFFRGLDIFIIASFALNSIIRLIWAPRKWHHIKTHPLQYILLFLFATQALTAPLLLTDINFHYVLNRLSLVGITKIYIVLMQIYILLELIVEIGRLNSRIARLPLPPIALFVSTFVFLIIAGTILLLLPGATVKGDIKLIDSLFTATSATCVTGLIVKPTASFFSRFGHLVILTLIQLGGLGLMTFGTFFAVIFRQQFGLKERVVLGDVLNVDVFGQIKNLLISIVVITFTIEIIGAVLLFIFSAPYKANIDSKIFWAIFHSISAFCNAGFSVWDKNIIEFTSDFRMTLTFAGLIILGGLGFVVLVDIWRYIISPWKIKKRKIPHFSLQTKIVITTSLLLILIGMFLLLIGDTTKEFTRNNAPIALLTAFFQAVTARTAGFNTINIGKLASGPLLILIILMFIGASPGSTGGGVKTTSIAVIFGSIKEKLKGRNKTSLFSKTVPQDIVNASAMIIVIALSIISIGTFLLCTFELKKHPNWEFIDMLFEVVSAFGTVGLSTGHTFDLCTGSKIVLIITMFLGRIGPLTFLLAITRDVRNKRTDFVQENIMVG